jgi:hypothetical protein
MKTRVGLMLAVVGGMAAAASAQQITPGSVAYTLEYDRVAANGTVIGPGTLQPGESARLRLRFNYSPAYGTAVTFPSSILVGSSGSGTIEGFWSGNLNVNGTGGTQGTWSGVTAGSLPVRRQLTGPFNAAGAAGAGTVNAAGTGLENLQPGQFTGNIDSVNSSNNFIVWTGAWTPTDYASRTVTFSLAAGSLGLPTYLAVRDNNGLELPVAGTVGDTRGSVSFQIIPAPSSLALLGLGGLMAARRRRA